MRRRTARTLFPLIAAGVLCASAAACSVSSAGSGAAHAPRTVIAPAGAASLAPYSPAIRSGGFLFLSGQVGLQPNSTQLVPGGITPETRQALENVRTILTAAGLTPDDVVKCTVFLASMDEYAAMNAVYAAFFTTAPPARSAVAVAGLPLSARVEIECIAQARA